MNAQTPTRTSAALRAAMLPIAGAGLAVVLALGVSIGFLTWRTGAQRRVLDKGGAQCRAGDRAACDALRSACLKRSGDACVTLADALLGPGDRHDEEEGVRLLSDACTYRHAGACLRAGRARIEGSGVTRDLGVARTLLDRGCDLGAHEACALRQTIPAAGEAR